MNKNNIIFCIAFIACSFFSTVQSICQETLTMTLEHDGMERSYILYVPNSYDANTPAPLVFNLHGYGSNANEQMWYGDFQSLANANGFLVCHPDGSLLDGVTHWNVGGWTLESTTDDVGFLDALIDELSENYTINQKRIYSTGMSNGGFMSFELACQLSHRIAAVASVTGSMTPQTLQNCSPERPVPVMQIHGIEDPTVPYVGDPLWTLSIEEVMAYWQEQNLCGIANDEIMLPNTNTADGTEVFLTVYTDCESEVTNEHFRIEGGAHTWPGTSFAFPGTSLDINASEEIWRFFSQYDLDGLIPTSSAQDIQNARFLSVFPNPSAEWIEIVGLEVGEKYTIQSMDGSTVFQGIKCQTDERIDVTKHASGIYFVQVEGQSLKFVIE